MLRGDEQILLIQDCVGKLNLTSIEAMIFPHYKEKNGLDGLTHIKHVVHMGNKIAFKECPDSIEDVILGCYLHDLGRHYEVGNETHGDAGEALAKKILIENGLHKSINIETIIYAIKNHDKGHVSDDPIVGSIWDADRLTLYRFPDKVICLEKLSTKTAISLCNYAKEFITSKIDEYSIAYS